MATFQLNVRPMLRQVERVKRALNDTQGLMGKIGRRGVQVSRQAFDDQRLGSFAWPERYPGQSEPFINIAGALSDFNKDKDPGPVRFARRPALGSFMRDSVQLQDVSPTSATWGSELSYSGVHQEGGESEQAVSDTAKIKIAEWLYTPRGNPFVHGDAAGKIGVFFGAGADKNRYRKGREGYAEKLEPLLFASELVTQVNQRPFLGVDEQFEAELIGMVKAHFEKKVS